MTNCFCLFARLLTCNSTQLKIHNYLDFSRTYWRLLENPKTWNSRKLCLHENNFKTYSTVNSAKWLKNWTLWFLELYFYLKYISNKVIGRKKQTIENNYEIHNGCSKMQKIYGFRQHWRIFYLLLNQNKKKINFINTLTSSGPYWRKCKNRGFWGVTFAFKWFTVFLQREFSNESLILKVFKTINGNKSFVKQILKSFSDRNIFLESPVFRFINSLLHTLKEKRKFKILICWVLG